MIFILAGSDGKTLKSFGKVNILALNGPRGNWSKRSKMTKMVKSAKNGQKCGKMVKNVEK